MFWEDTDIEMPDLYGNLYKAFLDGLEKAESADLQKIDRLELCRTESVKILELLRAHVYDSGFNSAEEEIYFFKEIKPRFYRFFIYYLKIYDIETEKPPIGNEYTQDYLKRHIDELHRFNNDNAPFLHYYRKKMTDRDSTYFTRQFLKNKYCLNPFSLDADPHFTTAKDNIISQYMAGQMLSEYIIQELAIQNISKDNKASGRPIDDDLIFTGSDVDIVEICKSFQLTGVFGKAPFSKIIAKVSADWHKPIKNENILLQEIGRRKKVIPKFLNSAAQSLITYYNEKD